jgi:hypothetical protein
VRVRVRVRVRVVWRPEFSVRVLPALTELAVWVRSLPWPEPWARLVGAVEGGGVLRGRERECRGWR